MQIPINFTVHTSTKLYFLRNFTIRGWRLIQMRWIEEWTLASSDIFHFLYLHRTKNEHWRENVLWKNLTGDLECRQKNQKSLELFWLSVSLYSCPCSFLRCFFHLCFCGKVTFGFAFPCLGVCSGSGFPRQIFHLRQLLLHYCSGSSHSPPQFVHFVGEKAAIAECRHLENSYPFLGLICFIYGSIDHSRHLIFFFDHSFVL